MKYVKLQFGCILVILYIAIAYLRAIKRGNIKTCREYNLLMMVAPLAVIFDGITAWTVNHMDIVPSVVNRLAHLLFFLFMDFTIILTSLYMYNLLIGYEKTAKWKKALLNLPGMVSVFLIIAEIGKLYYTGDTNLFSGSTTDCYISDNTFARNLYRFGESFYQTAGNAK